MGEIRSLSDCFNVEETLDGYLDSSFETINEYLEQHQNEILKNEDIYGKMTFHCGEYIPLDMKMKDISKSKIPDVRNNLFKCKQNVKKAFWSKRKRDLESYIAYCDEQIKLAEPGYQEFKSKGYTDKITMSTTFEKRKLENAYHKYIRFTEDRSNAIVEFNKSTKNIASLSSIDY